MPHYNAYDSFKTKKSIDKKNRAKEKSQKLKDNNDFIITSSDNYGIVIEVKYNEVIVFYNDEMINASIKSDLKLICNQVLLPGDKVVIEQQNNEKIITNLIKRTSLLSRTKKDRTRAYDMGTIKNIAANIDLVVIVVSAEEPPLHPRFIDRYLLITENSNINPIICLNKADLKTKEDDEILDIYRRLNISVIETSTYSNTGIVELKEYLKGKQAILVGHSGVGKSSLTNTIMGDTDIKTSSVSTKSKRGCHTTTSSKYYIWDETSSIIDTPGIRSLDVSSFDPLEVQEYFPEFKEWTNKCKYSDCMHFHEPLEDCMVKQAINNKLIDSNRYDSYIRIIDDILSNKQ